MNMQVTGGNGQDAVARMVKVKVRAPDRLCQRMNLAELGTALSRIAPLAEVGIPGAQGAREKLVRHAIMRTKRELGVMGLDKVLEQLRTLNTHANGSAEAARMREMLGRKAMELAGPMPSEHEAKEMGYDELVRSIAKVRPLADAGVRGAESVLKMLQAEGMNKVPMMDICPY